MCRRCSIARIILSVGCATATYGAPQITEWSSASTGFDIDNTNLIVTITAAGAYKFQSLDGGNLADINLIQVDDGVTGTVTIHIARDPNDSAGTDGATNVGSIDLTNSHATPVVGNLAELRITGNLGTVDESEVRNITGPVVLEDIERKLKVNVDVTPGGSITADEVTAMIEIDRNLNGDLTANSLGDVDIESSLGGSGGDITIHSSYSGTLFVNRRFNGNISIEGDLTGTININSNFVGGQIDVAGDLAVPGRIRIASQANNEDFAPIHVHGSIVGSGGMRPAIRVNTVLTGTIAIDVSLCNVNTNDPNDSEILVDEFAGLGAVAINYDGDPGEGDEWASGATVVVDGNTYDGTDGNNTTDRVWNVSPCKGDMNGDGSVETTGDGDPGPNTGPFFQSAATYRNNFPGLEGSRDWHEAIPKPGSAGVSPAWPGTFGGSGIASWRL